MNMCKRNKSILCGLYDKTCNPHEKTLLYNYDIPKNAKVYQLEENEFGFGEIIFNRSDFVFKKEDGTDQNYYGWYMLIPTDMNIISFNENCGAPMDIEFLKLKNKDNSDLIIDKDGISYQVYGKFNIAKTSDNWSLKVTIM